MQDEKTLDFLQKLKDSGNWNELYDYSKVKYLNVNTKVLIIDDLGFEHSMIPKSLTKGNELSILSANDKTAFFIYKAKLIHGDIYDYSLAEYNKPNDKIKIICSVHGVFEQDRSSHLFGAGC